MWTHEKPITCGRDWHFHVQGIATERGGCGNRITTNSARSVNTLRPSNTRSRNPGVYNNAVTAREVLILELIAADNFNRTFALLTQRAAARTLGIDSGNTAVTMDSTQRGEAACLAGLAGATRVALTWPAKVLTVDFLRAEKLFDRVVVFLIFAPNPVFVRRLHE